MFTAFLFRNSIYISLLRLENKNQTRPILTENGGNTSKEVYNKKGGFGFYTCNGDGIRRTSLSDYLVYLVQGLENN